MSGILGTPVHQAFVYPDFDAALKHFADGGIGPFYIMQTGGVGRYRGEDHPLSVKVAFVYTGTLRIIRTTSSPLMAAAMATAQK